VWPEVPLRPDSSRHLESFFGEDSSTFTNIFPGNFQVHLDHEDLRVQALLMLSQDSSS
jgi:hypothetical protein